MQAVTDSTDVGRFIYGQRVNGTGTRRQAVFNPATGARASKLRLGEVADVDCGREGSVPEVER